MRVRRGSERVVVCLALCAGLAGCGDEDGWRGVAGPPRDGGTVGPGVDAYVSHAPTGLPCDVAMVLATQCTSCHTNPPIGGAPMSLLSYEDLTRTARGMTITNAELSVMRMQDTTIPMPPAPSPMASAADVAVLMNWIAAGSPRGDCATPVDPYGTPVMCSSMTYWEGGDSGDTVMHPGRACTTCHDTAANPPDPIPTIAGTVYPSAHEPDDCNGFGGTAADPVTVEITDATGTTVTVPVNSVGNIIGYDVLTPPLTAVVRYQGRARAMASGAPSGDCNSCHTESGANGAPGRIMRP